MYKNWIYIEKFYCTYIYLSIASPSPAVLSKSRQALQQHKVSIYRPLPFALYLHTKYSSPCSTLCILSRYNFVWNVVSHNGWFFHTKIDVVLSVDNLGVWEHKAATCQQKDRKEKKTEKRKNDSFLLISYPFIQRFERCTSLRLVKNNTVLSIRRVFPVPLRQNQRSLLRDKTQKKKKNETKHVWEELQVDSCQRTVFTL